MSACGAERCAVSSSFSILGGSGGMRPSGGFSGVMSGIGIGIGTLVVLSWKNTMGIVLRSLSKLNDTCSTLLIASILVVRAGWGSPTRISGPQYALDVPGVGPGSR